MFQWSLSDLISWVSLAPEASAQPRVTQSAFSLQRCVHLTNPAGGGGGAGRAEQDALDLVALVTNVVLEEHHLVVGVVVIVDPGVIPINSRGEKQRMHLRDGFLADQLTPSHVASNM